MKKLNYLLLLLILGCSTEKRQNVLTIPLEYGIDNVLPFEESGLDYTYEIIPLKIDTSNMNSFIGQAYRFIVHKDCFYISDYSSAPKIFTTEGKFIQSLIKGRGPGEINGEIDDICIDRENNRLEVFQQSKNSIFTLSGDFVEETKNEDAGFTDILKFGDYYIRYDGSRSSDSSFVNIINHRTGKRVHELFHKKNKSANFRLLSNSVFQLKNENIYFNIPYTDEIYKIEQGDSIPHLFAKLTNLLRYEECPEFSFFTMNQYAQAVKENVMIGNLSISKDEKIISFLVRERDVEMKSINYRLLYDVDKNQLFRHPIESIFIGYSDDEYDYALVRPEELEAKKENFRESEKPLMKELCDCIDRNGMDTNPYVVKIKLFKK